MSSDLPDVLIAHLTTYLNYEDTCNLMETSKKNYYAIKGYKKDKPKFRSVEFYVRENPVSYSFREKNGFNNYKSYKLKNDPETDDVNEYIRNVLDECQSVYRISFPFYENHRRLHTGDLTLPLAKILHDTKVNISSVYVGYGSVDLSMDEFIHFCRKFKKSIFANCEFKFGIWSDEVLVEVYLHTNVAIMGKYKDREIHSANLLTDASLKTLICQKDDRLFFKIEGVPNSFTIKQIVKNLEILRARNIKAIMWDFGILPANQLLDADRYFNPKNGELKEFYKIKVTTADWSNVIKYKLGIEKEDDEPNHYYFGVTFSVASE